MTIPPLSTKSDVLPFARHLLSESALWELVDAFITDIQLRARQRYLADLAIDWQAQAGQARRDGDLDSHHALRTDAKQAALSVANWVTVDQPDPLPGADDVVARVTWLTRFAHRRWDVRCGEERDAIPTRAEMLSPSVCTAIYDLARRWGMLDPSPAAVAGEYEYVIVLGGLIRANINRPRAAADLLNAGTVSTSSVIGLGAARPMSPVELALAEDVGCPARTEQDALEFGLIQAFAAPDAQWVSTEKGHVRQLTATTGPSVSSVCAPMRQGTRADTGTAFQWFVDEADGIVRPGNAILSITTPIYWIASHTALLTQMPDDARLVTVGADPLQAPPQLRQTFRSQHYLQEIKSSIDALQRLLAWADIRG